MTMKPCTDCTALDRKPHNTPPHAAQKLTASQKHRHPSKGSINTYVCGICGSKMMQDVDLRDEFSRWEFEG